MSALYVLFEIKAVMLLRCLAMPGHVTAPHGMTATETLKLVRAPRDTTHVTP